MSDLERTTTLEAAPRRTMTFPHIFVVLFTFICIAALSTYLVDAGSYERTTTDQGQTVVVPGSYALVETDKADWLTPFMAVFEGMREGSSIIFFIFISGGAFGVLKATGVLQTLVASVSQALSGRDIVLIPLLMLLFAAGGATFGLAEETIAFIIILAPMLRLLGYDSITAAAVPLVGAGAGFSAAFMNPFTVGVAQDIAQLPIFSGMTLRACYWTVFVGVSIAFVTRYAARVKARPEHSPVYRSDRRQFGHSEPLPGSQRLSLSDKLVLTAFVGAIVAIAYGVIRHGWYIGEMSGVFLLMGILVGALARMGPNEIAEHFVSGIKEIAMGALVVGFAYGILIVLKDGSILDTILHRLEALLGDMPAVLTAISMFVVQLLLNFLVPSGSGQAALTMPLMVPLADLVGVTRQTAVLAFQLGDGISNIITPTSGYFMAGLAVAGVSWSKWIKWILPLLCLQLLLACGMVTLAHLLSWS
ncbi:YfcC family protein [Halomonas organivorans]|uniref:Putative ion transporter superfamily protein YfcC n=1 Tax=Halomonas organivorans TaxID=257772 RepID=A0A7W5C277_9GAMM|nr:AbgT family transporter [Halomonas organivorans]MBB3143019.1 putative ion transporter superfamily protein YfcC [Halomonas organivorans]